MEEKCLINCGDLMLFNKICIHFKIKYLRFACMVVIAGNLQSFSIVNIIRITWCSLQKLLLWIQPCTSETGSAISRCVLEETF